MNDYPRYLFLLSGFGIFISGVYFWGVCPFINALFPSIEFWNPPQAVLLVAAGGDMVTGLAIFMFGLVAAFVYPWVAGNWPDTAPQVYLGLGTGPAPLPSWLPRPHASHRRSIRFTFDKVDSMSYNGYHLAVEEDVAGAEV